MSNTFLLPPTVISPPSVAYAPGNRKFQGIPSVCITQENQLWATWYAGPNPKEDEHNYVVLAKSEDDGASWEEVLVVTHEDASVRTFDPEIWIAPNGKLLLFWAQTVGHDGTIAGVWFVEVVSKDFGGVDFSKPKRATDGVMMCKPMVLSTGEWVLPASTWRETDNSARMVISNDQGESWGVRGGCHVLEEDREYDEHMIVERKDHSLWMLVRMKYGLGESVSLDRGKTWSTLVASKIKHPSSRFFIQKLISGRILLIKHGRQIDSFDKDNKKFLHESWFGRNQLTAWLSDDEGVTWKGGLIIDERDNVSYPDGAQDTDGSLYITYDYLRKKEGAKILMAKITEKDILEGKLISENSFVQRTVTTNR